MLFCADLKKFQKLREVPNLKKEEDDEEEKIHKKKIKTAENRTVKNEKTKSSCHKKAKMSVKDEETA